jgi:hypothetical protein
LADRWPRGQIAERKGGRITLNFPVILPGRGGAFRLKYLKKLHFGWRIAERKAARFFISLLFSLFSGKKWRLGGGLFRRKRLKILRFHADRRVKTGKRDQAIG